MNQLIFLLSTVLLQYAQLSGSSTFAGSQGYLLSSAAGGPDVSNTVVQ